MVIALIQVPEREGGNSLRELGQDVPKGFDQTRMLGRHDHERKIVESKMSLSNMGPTLHFRI